MRAILLLALLTRVLPLHAQLVNGELRNGELRNAATVAPVAAGSASFSDNFNRTDADSLGANWTEIAGDIDIASNEANNPDTFGNDFQGAVYSGTACSTASQFAKVTLTANSGVNSIPGVILRYVDASSPFYCVRFDSANNLMRWFSHANAADAAGTLIDSAAFTVSFPITVGVTVVGLGDSTVIRGWTGPTADASDAGGTTWDTAGATASITTNPGTACDTGKYLGVGGAGAFGQAWDNFFGGDVP